MEKAISTTGCVAAALFGIILLIVILGMAARKRKAKKKKGRQEAGTGPERKSVQEPATGPEKEAVKDSGQEPTIDLGEKTETETGKATETEKVPGKEKVSHAVIRSVVVNSKGRIRRNNEDNFLLNGAFLAREKLDQGAVLEGLSEDETQVYAVCDGMGGEESGEDASLCAVTALADLRDRWRELTKEDSMNEAIRTISFKVADEAASRGQRSGTTLALVLIDGRSAYVTNVGDSRIYRLRNGSLQQLSLDHTKVRRMVSMGMLTEEQAKSSPERHQISQFLGMPKEILLSPHNVFSQELQKGDTFLICSDGLTDMVEDSQIKDVLTSQSDPGTAAQKLHDMAMEHGGRDNTTVLLLRAEEVT